MPKITGLCRETKSRLIRLSRLIGLSRLIRLNRLTRLPGDPLDPSIMRHLPVNYFTLQMDPVLKHFRLFPDNVTIVKTFSDLWQ